MFGRRTAQAAFHRLDIDGDGDIDKDDLRGMLAVNLRVCMEQYYYLVTNNHETSVTILGAQGMDEGAIDRLIAQAVNSRVFLVWSVLGNSSIRLL